MGKYRAKPTTVDGVRFASKREATRYCVLKLYQRAGSIADLELQPRFPLVVNGQLVCTYVADFRYFDVGTNRVIVEDSKGFRTPAYKIKKKLLAAIHGIEVLET